MQTHKNPTLRTGPAPFKAPVSGSNASGPSGPVDKPPQFVRDGKKWLIVSTFQEKKLDVQFHAKFFRNTKKAITTFWWTTLR